MFSQFGSAARAVIRLAEQECRNASHYFLGTEHLLLAMAVDPPPDIAQWFAERGLEPWAVKRALRAEMDGWQERSWEGVVITPRTRAVLAAACTAHGGAPNVTPRDIIDAIVADGGGVAARVLEQLARERVR